MARCHRLVVKRLGVEVYRCMLVSILMETTGRNTLVVFAFSTKSCHIVRFNTALTSNRVMVTHVRLSIR